MQRELDLEALILQYTTPSKSRNHKMTHRKVTAVLTIFLLCFFAVYGLSFVAHTSSNTATGMATFVGQATEATGDFVNAVKTSPERPMIMVFFYILWIIVVLVIVGAMAEKEITDRMIKSKKRGK
jgi:uncharacterized membrane protein YadS